MARKSKNSNGNAENDNATNTEMEPKKDVQMDNAINDFPSPIWKELTPEQREKTKYVQFVDLGKSYQNTVLPGKTLSFIDFDDQVKDSLTEWQNYDLETLGLLMGAGIIYCVCRGEGQRGVIRRITLDLPGQDRAKIQAHVQARTQQATQKTIATGNLGIQTLAIASYGSIPFPEGMTQVEKFMYIANQQLIYELKEAHRANINDVKEACKEQITTALRMCSTVLDINKEHHATEAETKQFAFMTVEALSKRTSKALAKNGTKNLAKMFAAISEDKREENKQQRKMVEKLTDELKEATKKKNKKESISEWLLAGKELAKEFPEMLNAIEKFQDGQLERNAQKIADEKWKKEQEEQQKLLEQQKLAAQNTDPLRNQVHQVQTQQTHDPNAPAMNQPPLQTQSTEPTGNSNGQQTESVPQPT